MSSEIQLQRLRRRANLATVREAAEITGVAQERIRSALKRGLISRRGRGPAQRGHDSTVLVDLEDVEVLPDLVDRAGAMLADLRCGFTDAEVAESWGIDLRSLHRTLQRRGMRLGELA